MPVRRKSGGKRKNRRIGFALIFAGCSILLLLLWGRLFPLIREMAAAEAENAVTQAINDVLADLIRSGELDYDKLIHLEKDDTGGVTAVYADMGRISLLRGEITRAVMREILDRDRVELRLPMGNLLGVAVLSGSGPALRLRILAVESIRTDLSSRFTAAGINQTLHQIRVEMQVSVRVLVPGGFASGSVTARLPVAETLIMGRVPESYTYFEGSEQWDEPLERFDILN